MDGIMQKKDYLKLLVEDIDRVAGMGGLAIQPLAQNRSRDRQCEDERRTIAEKQHTGDGSGQQRNADIPHDARGRSQ